MERIIGTNLGNWLVLERWMMSGVFDETNTEDETWLNRKSNPNTLAKALKQHRDTYITEQDFKIIAEHGINTVRIPVPFFVFGDVEPYKGCIEYLDMAMDWAEKWRIKILIDLHTAPDGQNGYDNGGICGVCKWSRQPQKVEFCITVLERLAKRYGTRSGLFGIEALNEPISWSVWITSPSRKTAVDKKEAKGSGCVKMSFLKKFYIEVYKRLRDILPEDKIIVFHDGFRLTTWKDFFVQNNMKNVMLDTHIYIFAMEQFVPIHRMWVYKLYMKYCEHVIKRAMKYTPVVIGEWCICNKFSMKIKKSVMIESQFNEQLLYNYKRVAKLQLDTWEAANGYFYWNYQLQKDMSSDMKEFWKNSWDLRRCWEKGWIPEKM